ncbi:MAG: 16S rRNA (cytidine(1402)-2'-O)-methyltransferase [Bacilli bacterium]
MRLKSYSEAPKLYLIPTPIGNMKDITLRSLEILKEVDILLCEDTRETGLFLKQLNIKKKLIACHDYNEDTVKEKALSYLKGGYTIGLVTDRGTPIISDPGYKVVKFIINNGYAVVSLPGATAFVPALTMSSLSPSPFLFYGFLNAKSSKRKLELKALELLPYTLIFYESPHRMEETLKDILTIFGNRYISLTREISKLYEEVIHGTVEEVLSLVATLKGEMVLVVEGNLKEKDYTSDSIEEQLTEYLNKGYNEKDAIKEVAHLRGIAKNEVYQVYHVKEQK